MGNNNHIWQFARIGGVNRVCIESGDDLIALETLDQKLWAALSCPVSGLEIDSKTLELIDTDKDGKIRVPEIIEAVKWILSVIKNPNDLIKENKELTLAAINENSSLGSELLSSSKQILINIGKPDNNSLNVDDTSDIAKIFANTKFNGDGIITEDSTDDEEIKDLINKIINCIGSQIDRSGKQGINTEQIELFYQNCNDYIEWYNVSVTNNSLILPYGSATQSAFDLYLKLQSKIDDYFLRCQMASYDINSKELLNSISSRVEALNNKELSCCIEEIASLPIAKIEANKALPLIDGINPAWIEIVFQFKHILYDSANISKAELTEEEWIQIENALKPYQEWILNKKGISVEQLGIEVIKEILSNNKKNKLIEIVELDKAIEKEANNIILVDKLVRYYRDLFKLLKNFVTFSDFYSPPFQAIFQNGSLYFDQRRCDLCIKVSDMSRHNAMAASSGICLVYCDCISKAKNKKMTIVAAFTDGDVDNLVVGRNAVFYDRNGLDWDATVVKIIENPISIRQAFWSPYRKMSKFISKQIEKIASSKEQEVSVVATSSMEKTSDKVNKGISDSIKSPEIVVPTQTKSTDVVKPAPFDIAKFAGIFAAIGLAFGAIGSVLAFIVGGFLALTWWKMPLALLGVILAISGPSMILAWLKLRKRNLAPVLDANGWAINAKANINIPFGITLTHLAKLPKNAKMNYIDPFTKKKSPVLLIVLICIIILQITYLLWHYGYLKF